MSEDTWLVECENCGSEIEEEEYDRTGTTEFCESCPELMCDPRSHTFGTCECYEEGE